METLTRGAVSYYDSLRHVPAAITCHDAEPLQFAIIELTIMGDPSSLRLVPADSASIPIDWSRVPEATKKFLLRGWGYDWENQKDRPLPETVGDLAKMFDESKFFGYMAPKLCTLLMDISEFGLAVQASGIPPRFYMKYLEQVWFILFFPGKRDGITAYSRDTVRRDEDDVSDDEGEDQRMIAEELRLAHEFDAKLPQQFSQGAADIVDITNRLCGWEASALHQTLESAQFMTAIQTLPMSHPAYKAMFQGMFSGRGSGLA